MTTIGALTFIAWTVVIILLFGILILKSFGQILKSEDERIKEDDRFTSEAIIQKYNEMNFAERMNFVFFIGASILGFVMFGWINKDKNKEELK